MNRRIIFIILAAVAFAVLVGLVWFWFFRGGAPGPATTGEFGTGSDKPAQTATQTPSNNNQASNVLPSGGGQGGNTSSQTISVSGGAGGSSTVQPAPGVATVPGVEWLGGSGGSSGGGQTTTFIPKTTNQLNDGTVGGSPGILGSFGGGTDIGGSGSGLEFGGVLGAVGGCAAYSAILAAGEAFTAAEGGTQALTGGFVLVYDWRSNTKQASKQQEGFLDCIARTIGKAVIAQMTNSIVNWINSGFNGQPSFVTNFDRFFTNVGDQAAGEFIRGTPLAFLCSPFQLQIRIAIAQSYARRSNAPSCTLSTVIKNVNSFMSGNFSQGGWGGLIQFTTVPTNNPYGAYAYAQVGLATAQSNAIASANRNVTPGGFISLQKCDGGTSSSGGGDPTSSSGKNCKVVTPGAIIEDSLKTTLQQPFLANQLAKSFDEIISALLNQLVTRTLYSGLSSLSGTNGYAANYLTPEQQQAQTDAQRLLTDMQGRLQFAQQYGAVQQGSIQDIQNTQQQLHTLADCWAGKGDTTQASSTEDVLRGYDSLVDSYNDRITRANAGIAALQDFQTQIINAGSAAAIASVRAAYERALTGGVIITAADVTTAQQDRTSLQTTLQSRNQLTSSQLDQCYAS